MFLPVSFVKELLDSRLSTFGGMLLVFFLAIKPLDVPNAINYQGKKGCQILKDSWYRLFVQFNYNDLGIILSFDECREN